MIHRKKCVYFYMLLDRYSIYVMIYIYIYIMMCIDIIIYVYIYMYIYIYNDVYIYIFYLCMALIFRWIQLFQPCPAAGTFEMAAKPLGTSANFKPADGDK